MGAGSGERGDGSGEMGAGSWERGVGSGELGAGSWEVGDNWIAKTEDRILRVCNA